MFSGRVRELRDLIYDVFAPARPDIVDGAFDRSYSRVILDSVSHDRTFFEENDKFYKILAILFFISEDYYRNNVCSSAAIYLRRGGPFL